MKFLLGIMGFRVKALCAEGFWGRRDPALRGDFKSLGAVV